LWDPIGELREYILVQITYSPCGPDNPKVPCMYYKVPNALLICQKEFPKVFTAKTIVCEDYYLQYYQCDNSQTFTVHKPGMPGEEVVCNNC
jgi:hypothetical protein